MSQSNPLTFPYSSPATGEWVEIVPGLRWLRMPLPWELDHINLYLLKQGASWVLIDAGMPGELDCQRKREIMLAATDHMPISQLLLTHHHPDHLGCAVALAKALGAHVLMHPLEHQTALDHYHCEQQLSDETYQHYYAPCGIEREQAVRLHGIYTFFGSFDVPETIIPIHEGDTLASDLGDWNIITSGGHSPGQCMLYQAGRRLLLSADVVLPDVVSTIGISPWSIEEDPLGSDLVTYDTLHVLPEETLVLPSHGLPFHGLHPRIDAIAEYWCDYLQQIEAECHQPITISALLASRGKDNPINQAISLSKIKAAVVYLLAEKRISMQIDAGVEYYCVD